MASGDRWPVWKSLLLIYALSFGGWYLIAKGVIWMFTPR